MDQACRGFWPPVSPQVPQNYMRNTSQRCGVAGLMSGAYQGQIGVDVGASLGALKGRVPVGMFAVESPLSMGLGGLGDACGVATTAGTIANVIGQIMQTVGMSTPGAGATHAYGTQVTAGAQTFSAAMRSACPTHTTPSYTPSGSSTYEQQMLAMVQAQQAAQAQAARDQAKALQEQKSNTMLLVGGGVVLAAIIGVALYLKR